MNPRLLPLLLSLFLAASASAQMRIAPAPGEAITGTVSAVDGSRLLLFDDRIVLDASGAAIRGLDGRSTIAAIGPGDRIMATIGPAAGGSELRAQVIQILTPAGTSLHGTVQAVDPLTGAIDIFGQTVRITSATILRGYRGLPLNSLSDVLSGQEVRIELDPGEPGLTARTVMVMAPVGGMHNAITGVVEAIDDNVWTVRGEDRGIRVVATDQTQIVGTPRAGDRVTVIYRTDASGQHFALSIAPAADTPRPPHRALGGVVAEAAAPTLQRESRQETVRVPGMEKRIVFVGTALSIRGNVWEIDGRRVIVAPRTNLIHSPGPGDRVHVIATQSVDGTFALEIETVF